MVGYILYFDVDWNVATNGHRMVICSLVCGDGKCGANVLTFVLSCVDRRWFGEMTARGMRFSAVFFDDVPAQLWWTNFSSPGKLANSLSLRNFFFSRFLTPLCVDVCMCEHINQTLAVIAVAVSFALFFYFLFWLWQTAQPVKPLKHKLIQYFASVEKWRRNRNSKK